VFVPNKKISSESHATSVVDQLNIMLRCTRHGYNSPHITCLDTMGVSGYMFAPEKQPE